MRTRHFALAAIGVAVIAAPAVAQGQSDNIFTPSAQRAFGLEPYELAYEKARDAATAVLPADRVGRDVVIAGWHQPNGIVRHATETEVTQQTKHLRSLAARARAADQATQAASSVAPAAGGGYASAATAQCESGGDYTTDTGNGYYGAYQFDQQTWDAYAPKQYVGTNPAEVPPAVQDATAASVTTDAWPNCP